jgi:hypothetical protein
VSSVTVHEERETTTGWSFDVSVDEAANRADDERAHAPNGRTRAQSTLHVQLSWVDYDHISGGSASPAKVVHAIVEAALDRGVLRDLGERFDAARATRRIEGLLDDVRSRL